MIELYWSLFRYLGQLEILRVFGATGMFLAHDINGRLQLGCISPVVSMGSPKGTLHESVLDP